MQQSSLSVPASMTGVCWDELGESSWYNVLKFVVPAPPGDIFMNFYSARQLDNESLQECGMPRPLRGRLKHDGQRALICEGELPLYSSHVCISDYLTGLGLSIGAVANKSYFLWLRDTSGLLEAALCWSPGIDTRYAAWVTVGYDVQKWKVIGSSCHPILPLCKMISKICYSFPLVRYKYCLFANLNFAVPQQSCGLYIDGYSDIVDEWSALFRFSTIEESSQCIDCWQDLDIHGIWLERIENLKKGEIVPLG